MAADFVNCVISDNTGKKYYFISWRTVLGKENIPIPAPAFLLARQHDDCMAELVPDGEQILCAPPVTCLRWEKEGDGSFGTEFEFCSAFGLLTSYSLLER